MEVTVESCLKRVDNRFKLVLLAAKRAKDLDRGARAAVARDNDKSTIVAMREISEDAISLETLENITRSNIVNGNNEMLIDEEEDFINNEEIEESEDKINENDIDEEYIEDEEYNNSASNEEETEN
ncbi:MAG: DNA-directed RNA polymerase subunit omega [Alphaproteobacteria bacterium]|nr:DNA-directed RNA polymerase subunit omega [Alphaproteobacteria bacterium]